MLQISDKNILEFTMTRHTEQYMNAEYRNALVNLSEFKDIPEETFKEFVEKWNMCVHKKEKILALYDVEDQESVNPLNSGNIFVDQLVSLIAHKPEFPINFSIRTSVLGIFEEYDKEVFEQYIKTTLRNLGVRFFKLHCELDGEASVLIHDRSEKDAAELESLVSESIESNLNKEDDKISTRYLDEIEKDYLRERMKLNISFEDNGKENTIIYVHYETTSKES